MQIYIGVWLKIFDFIDKLRAKQSDQKEIALKKHNEKKKDLGTCVPLHALSEKDRKKRLQENDSLESDLKKKPKTEEEIDFIDKGQKKETKIKDELDLPTFGQKKDNPKPTNLIELDEMTHKQKAFAEEKKEIEEQLTIPVKEKAKPIRETTHDSTNLFKVTGFYDFGTTTMISGIVERGTISVKMKAETNGKEMEITEIKMGSTKIRALNKNEEGSLFMKTKGNPFIKYDDVLEFN